MRLRSIFVVTAFSFGLFSLLASTGCVSKPYNNFKPDYRGMQGTTFGTGGGAVIAAAASTATGPGALIGGAAGAIVGSYSESKAGLRQELYHQGIEIVDYGDMTTLIVPTDKFFVFDTADFNEVRSSAFINIVKLIKLYPQSTISITGFTDEVGSWQHKKTLSLHRAKMIRTFLWANGVELQRLRPAGYGSHNDVASNATVLGSTMNRRVEIQWWS